MFTPTKRADDVPRLRREGSFTLIETMIALAIISFLIVEVASVQGNAIVFSDFGRNISQATWLARRVLSQVEYYWHTKPFKDLEVEQGETKFEDFDEYSYSLEIKEWKFPFIKMLENALGGQGGDKSAKGDDKAAGADSAKAGDSSAVNDGGISSMIETVVKQVFGDEPIFMTAHVEVSWPEGAVRNSTSLTYLITNQAKLDTAIVALKPVWDKLTKPPPKPGKAGRGQGRGGDTAGNTAGGDTAGNTAGGNPGDTGGNGAPPTGGNPPGGNTGGDNGNGGAPTP